ncbi:MAG TPA: glycosyltransferase family 4 protein [Nitrospirales bacterium]|nr:hypothetical protein [Nitrospiraceae bacterium]HNP29164.1 glycosyltransferase family 4 protein [Nitrospirales bacterium]
MTHRLCVLMIAPQFRPLVGGYERAAERLSVELVRLGQEVTVIAERRDRSWPAREQQDGVMVRRLRCIYRPGIHALSSLLSFAAFLLTRGWQYHVIHVHQYGYHAALAVLVGRMLKLPVVIKITSTGTQGIEQALAGEQKAPGLLAALHRKMDACIATTVEAQGEAVRFGIPQDRIRLIPNGIDTDFFKPCDTQGKTELKSRLGLGTSLTVLYSGRLSPVKNPEGLIEAWNAIYRDVPNAELVLIGEGPLRKVLEDRVAALGLNASVRLVGHQPDVLLWYQAADIFILPSHREGLSNSLLEAMSCGLPVVSTRVSGCTDIFAESDIGEIVDVGDFHGLARALGSLLTHHPTRRDSCGFRAREFARTRFSIQAVAEKTLALYARLVEGGPRYS